jgi:hypothetical protein
VQTEFLTIGIHAVMNLILNSYKRITRDNGSGSSKDKEGSLSRGMVC